MQTLAHGIDLVDCSRLKAMIDRHGDHFTRRVFTDAELRYADRHIRTRIEKLAGRFAAKEAILKLIGTGWRGGISWTDMEIINNDLGQPIVNLSGQVLQIVDRLGVEQISLSITHTANLAIASAVAIVGSHEGV